MHTILKDMDGCIWCLNNILIYAGNTEAEHGAIVERVLQQCVEHELAVNLLKSKFHVYKIIFLGYVFNGQEVKIDPFELESKSKWPIPTNKK